MPIKWKSKILLAKVETTYATDAAPTGADNAILATNIVMTPMDGQDISRELELPWLGGQATVPTQLSMRLQFRVELVPSGAAGTAPAWGPVIRCLGVEETIVEDTSVAYTPISDDHESLSIHFYIGGTRFVMKGSRGTGVMRLDAQGLPYLECDYRGLFTVASEQSRPTVDLSAFIAPQVVTSATVPVFTIATKSLVMRNFSLDLGNDVQTRFLVGSESVLIVDRADRLACQVEAVPLSTWDPYTAALEQTAVAVAIQHGNVAGRKLTLSIPRAQLQRPGAFANQQNILEWQLNMVPLFDEGDDQWTLTLT